jgi:hypothetical protein
MREPPRSIQKVSCNGERGHDERSYHEDIVKHGGDDYSEHRWEQTRTDS